MFDLAIIGGGPAGYTAASRALAHNLSVVIFERENLGGTCLNVGCIPTKTLLHSSKLYRHILDAEKFGITVESVSFDFGKVQQRKTRVVRRLVAGVRQTVKDATFVNAPVRVVNYSNHVTTLETATETYEAQNLLICTGSENSVPPVKGIDLPHVIDSTRALALDYVPRQVVIVGGGVIGIEFAQLWRNFGAKVTVVEMQPGILPNLDADISTALMQSLKKQGIDFLLDTRVTEITPEAVITDRGSVEADQVLVCTGRRPCLTGVEALNLPFEDRRLKIGINQQTPLPGVYAAGDVTGKVMLAHTAIRQAEVAVNNMLGIDDTMRYDNIPSVVYSDPEIASVGITGQEATAQYGEQGFKVVKIPMLYSGRFAAENEGEQGLCKIIADLDNTLLGVHLIGNGSSEIITTAAMAITCRQTADSLLKVVFPHPTVSEIIKAAAEKLL